jgi:Na+-translocating ferredoxin:NAD+ oxidoreductase RnfC subunit
VARKKRRSSKPTKRRGSRRFVARRRRVSRNSGRWEWAVHGVNASRRPDPFSRMTKDELVALHTIHSSEAEAERLAKQLQGKYGPDIMFSVKGRPVGSWGTGISRAYAATEVLRSMPRAPRRAAKRRSSRRRSSRRR